MRHITNGEEILNAIQQGLHITDDKASYKRAEKFADTVSGMQNDLDSLFSQFRKLKFEKDAQKYIRKTQEGLDGLEEAAKYEKMFWEDKWK